MPIPEEFKWAFFNHYPHIINQFESRLVSIWGLNFKRAKFDCFGTGFIVSSGKTDEGQKSAIVVTAAHVVSSALRSLRPESLREQLSPFAPPIAKYITPLLKSHELYIMIGSAVTPGISATLQVHSISIIEEIDLCVLDAGRVEDQPDYERFNINSDPLTVGTTVAIAGYPQMHDPVSLPLHMSQSGEETLKRSINHRLQIRVGKIIKVEGSMRHKPVFGYETNIPIPPGMSGAPMFTIDDNDKSLLEVVGICMSDATVGDLNDVTTDGSSFVIGAQNLWCMPELNRHKVESWQKSQEGSPPFGSFFNDQGRRVHELSITVANNAPYVVRSGCKLR